MSSHASRVFAGILSSRLLGFVRQALYAHFLGVSPHADVLETAFRGPNLLQNLLGEGTISASFIPIYSRLLAEGREEDAARFAGAALGLLAATAFGTALIGVLLAPWLIPLLFFEWEPWQHELGIEAVRILFVMVAFLVVSAWALGVLNSHRKFFLSYVAPVVWNGAQIAALLVVWALAWNIDDAARAVVVRTRADIPRIQVRADDDDLVGSLTAG